MHRHLLKYHGVLQVPVTAEEKSPCMGCLCPGASEGYCAKVRAYFRAHTRGQNPGQMQILADYADSLLEENRFGKRGFSQDPHIFTESRRNLQKIADLLLCS